MNSTYVLGSKKRRLADTTRDDFAANFELYPRKRLKLCANNTNQPTLNLNELQGGKIANSKSECTDMQRSYEALKLGMDTDHLI